MQSQDRFYAFTCSSNAVTRHSLLPAHAQLQLQASMPLGPTETLNSAGSTRTHRAGNMPAQPALLVAGSNAASSSNSTDEDRCYHARKQASGTKRKQQQEEEEFLVVALW